MLLVWRVHQTEACRTASLSLKSKQINRPLKKKHCYWQIGSDSNFPTAPCTILHSVLKRVSNKVFLWFFCSPPAKVKSFLFCFRINTPKNNIILVICTYTLMSAFWSCEEFRLASSYFFVFFFPSCKNVSQNSFQ